MSILSNLIDLFPALDLGAPSDPDFVRGMGYLYAVLGFAYVAVSLYALAH